MQLHHGLLFLDLIQSGLIAGYTEAQLRMTHPTAGMADGLSQHVSHSAPPLQTPLFLSLCPALRPPFPDTAVRLTTTVYGKKNALQRAFRQFLLCVLMPPKNFQKFCAVSLFIFFLSTTYRNAKEPKQTDFSMLFRSSIASVLF